LHRELRELAGVKFLPDHATSPNLAVLLGDVEGHTRSKHLLHVQGRLRLATTSDSRLLRAVIRSAAALAADQPVGTLRLDASILLDPHGRAMAIDNQLGDELRRLEPRARRSNYRIIDTPFIDVDTSSATIVLPEWRELTGLSADALDGRWPSDPGADDLRAGHVQLGTMIYAGHPFAESRAAAISEMTPMVLQSDRTVRTEDVRKVAELAERIETRATPGGPSGLVSALDLGGASRSRGSSRTPARLRGAVDLDRKSSA
jgi:hypothetical protein